MTEPANTATSIHLRLSEIADGIGVSTATCSTWRRRHADFPAEIQPGSYAADAAIDWLDKRPIPRAYRKTGEPDGATYGDRLRHELAERAPARTLRETDDEAARQLLSTGLPRRFRDAGVDDIDYLDAGLLLIFTWICSERHWDRITEAIHPRTATDQSSALLSVVAAAVDDALRLHGLPADASRTFEGLRKVRRTDLVALIRSAGRAGRRGFDSLLAQLVQVAPATSGDYCTPTEVADFMAACVTPPGRSVQTVFDPYIRLGELPVAVQGSAGTTTPLRVHGTSRRVELARRAGLNLVVHGCDADIRVNDKRPWQYPIGGPYDAVVVNPPFNEIFSDSSRTGWAFEKAPYSSNFAWAQAAIAALAQDGRAAVLMPASAGGSNNRRERENREEMVERGAVCAVIRIPAQIFPVSSVDTAIWVLRPPSDKHREVMFADVRTMVMRTPGSRPRMADLKQIADLVNAPSSLKQGIATIVEHGGRAVLESINTIRGTSYSLVPDDYLIAAPTDADDRWQRIGASETGIRRAIEKVAVGDIDPSRLSIGRPEHKPADSWNEAKLADLCEIQSGPSNAYDIKYVPDGAFPILKAKHIRPRELAVPGSDSRTTSDIAQRLKKFDVRENDILFVRVGQVGEAAIARREHCISHIATNVIRLRLREKDVLDPEYLLEWLLTDSTRNRIRSRAAINSVPSISSKDLGQFVLRYPSIKKQRDIAEALKKCDLWARACQEAAEQSEAYRTAVADGLLSGAAEITSPSSKE